MLTGRILFHRTVSLHRVLRLERATWTRTFSVASHTHFNCILSEKNRHRRTVSGCLKRTFLLHCGKFGRRQYSTQETPERLSMKDDLVRSYVKHLHDKFEEAGEFLTTADDSGETQVKLKEVKRFRTQYATITTLYKQYEDIKQHCNELSLMIEETGSEDPEMKKMLEKEISETLESLSELDEHIMLHVVAPELGDDSDILIELNAGAGGQEAMLFTGEIYEMYMNYAAYKGWSVEQVNTDLSPIGGLRKASFTVSGSHIYKLMKYEIGVHRVQRVPKTEKGGRLHTSTMSVAVLPTPKEIDIVIAPSDLKMDTFRASGPGGQHVNKTDSAVRLTHKPSGMVVECQATPSQIRNRAQALKILRTRLYDAELSKQMEETHAKRKIQTGSRARNEKIRTYNYNQDRVTDHRLSKNVHNLPGFLQGGEQLDEMIERLMEASRLERLRELLDQFQKNNQSLDQFEKKQKS